MGWNPVPALKYSALVKNELVAAFGWPLVKGIIMNTPLLDGMMKTAIIGPAIDLGHWGIPSGIGALIGHARAKKDPNPREYSKKSIDPLQLLLLPGYTGYHLARQAKSKNLLEELKNSKK